MGRFRDMFQDNLQSGKFFADYSGFGPEFTRTLRLVEEEAKLEKLSVKKPKTFEESEKSQKSIKSMIVTPENDNKSKPKKESKKSVKIVEDKVEEVLEQSIANDDGDTNELDEQTRLENLRKLTQKGSKKSPKSPTPKSPGKGKKATTWDPVTFGGKVSKETLAGLDRTVGKPEDATDVDLHFDQYVPNRNLIGNSANLGSVGYEESFNDDESASSSKSGGGMFSMFTNLVGNKAITREDLEPVLAKLRDNLIAKNVAAEVANDLTESVMVTLEGSVMGTFQSLLRTVKDALNQSLFKLLTPKRRIDVLRDVMDAKENRRPYVITFCGVNGVGKSTNLAKICFWLIENKFSVLIAACDTFRAGAVEQLRTHVKRLNSMYPSRNPNEKKDIVELYEKGYGKDAAGIAMEAINHARASHHDVVLIDTAGRMQDNEPLMRSLSKLIGVNDPDLVLFVGEALVGNEAVDQLVKFNRALADHSQKENPHTIDGIVLTKFDTIDDNVGSAIAMTDGTGQPIVFVGTGQTYTDLKTINSKAVVQLLMK